MSLDREIIINLFNADVKRFADDFLKFAQKLIGDKCTSFWAHSPEDAVRGDVILLYDHRLRLMGRRLQRLRKRHGLMQSELGAICDASASTVGNIEQGRNAPSLYILLALADYFGVTTDYLLVRDVSTMDFRGRDKISMQDDGADED